MINKIQLWFPSLCLDEKEYNLPHSQRHYNFIKNIGMLEDGSSLCSLDSNESNDYFNGFNHRVIKSAQEKSYLVQHIDCSKWD